MLNHILNDGSHKMKFAVIENEFGEVGVDEKVLSENVSEEVVEVMNGCICCTVRGDLVEALKKLYNKVEKFDGVLIETTGLADPAPWYRCNQSRFDRCDRHCTAFYNTQETTACGSEKHRIKGQGFDRHYARLWPTM